MGERLLEAPRERLPGARAGGEMANQPPEAVAVVSVRAA
jgi:hypothetical protein